MGFKCCVPSCNSGYAYTPKSVSLFRFPVNNPDMLAVWKKRIPRDFEITDSTRICSLHFQQESISVVSQDTNNRRKRARSAAEVQVPRLLPTAVPTIFPDLPSYLSTVVASRPTTFSSSEARLHLDNLRLLDAEVDFMNTDCITSLDDIKLHFEQCEVKPSRYSLLSQCDDSFLTFVVVDTFCTLPSLRTCIKVFSDLSFEVFHNFSIIPSVNFSAVMNSSQRIQNFSDFLNLLAFLNSQTLPLSSPIPFVSKVLDNYLDSGDVDPTVAKKVSFLADQLAMVHVAPNRLRYSPAMYVTSILIHSHGAAAYRQLLAEGILTLPSERSLRRVCRSLTPKSDSDLSQYLRLRVSNLSAWEKNVSLIFDEVYVYQTLDYSNGKFFGLSEDGRTACTTVLCFMIKSISGDYSDVISLIPINGLTMAKIKIGFHSSLQLAHGAGLSVVVTLCDNHPVNRQFLKDLCGGDLRTEATHPIDNSQKLAVVIDPTHVFKNIYSNFQLRKNFRIPLPDGTTINPSFHHIQSLHAQESGSSLRIAHKLSQKVLSPSNVQRTSTKLACSVFHESTLAGLQFFCEQGKPWSDTARFVDIVMQVWHIVNVKSPTVGVKKRDPLRELICSPDDPRLQQLSDFADLMDEWKNAGSLGLSRETNSAAALTFRSLCILTKRLFTSGALSYVLLGQIQSDPLESRFGRYRGMSGSNFFVSHKQILQSESKIRISMLLSHSGLSAADIEAVDFSTADDSSSQEEVHCFQDSINLDAIHLEPNELSVIFFVGGYCVHTWLHRTHCPHCLELLQSPHGTVPQVEGDTPDLLASPSSLFRVVNRGGLTPPSTDVYLLCVVAYHTFGSLKSHSDFYSKFLNSPSACSLFVRLVNSLLPSSATYSSILCAPCRSGHHHETVKAHIISTCFNTLCKNFVRDFECNMHSHARTNSKITKLKSKK